MCIGIPVRLLARNASNGTVESDEGILDVCLMLVPDAVPGDDLLLHAGIAVRRLDPEEARLIRAALAGVRAVLCGEPVDAHFADLIDREPTLPAHLVEGRAP